MLEVPFNRLSGMKELNLIFNQRNELVRIIPSRVVFFEADGNYCHATYANKLRVALPVSLAQLERVLAENKGGDEFRFVHLGKRFIVNVEYLLHISVSKQEVTFADPAHQNLFRLSVSKEALKALKNLYAEKVVQGN